MPTKFFAIVLLAFVALVACDPFDSNAPQNRRDTTAAPKTAAEVTEDVAVLHDFEVSPASPQTTLARTNAPRMGVGRGSVAIFAVARASISAECLVAAQLRLYVQSASRHARDELALYPSHVFNALTKQNGDKFGYSGSALDIRPRATMDAASPGWSHWDVTDIVKLWLSRKPFPSMGKRVPRSGPVVFTLRDVDGATPFATATVLSSNSEHNKPHLLVSYEEDCATH